MACYIPGYLIVPLSNSAVVISIEFNSIQQNSMEIGFNYVRANLEPGLSVDNTDDLLIIG